MELVDNPEGLFIFEVQDDKGETVFTLEGHGEFMKVRYPSGLTHDEKMKIAMSFPYPIYDGCVYEVPQLAVLLGAYSESEYERFLEAYEKAGGQCIIRSQGT